MQNSGLGNAINPLISIAHKKVYSIPLLLIWILLVWKKSKNREIHDDPIVFAIKDKTSISIAFLFFLCFLLAKLIEL